MGSIVILGGPTKANLLLVDALRGLGFAAELAAPREARRRVRARDVAVARLDVTPALDGVEAGLLELLWLERSGARVVNSVRSLLAAHDKLRTARILEQVRLPHPATAHVTSLEALARVQLPFVVKPRFGSWGRDVMRCRGQGELARCVAEVAGRRWFARHGALVQELLPFRGRDLRLVVAAGKVVGAVERTAAAGEWRTNVSLGGSRRAVEPPAEACELAVAAAFVTGAGLVGVDLFPVPSGGWLVLELNGAVEFDDVYSLAGRGVYVDLAEALALGARAASAVG